MKPSTLAASALVLIMLSAVAHAVPPYAAVGAPKSPKVDARWNRYHNHAEATRLLKQLAKAHPKLCKLKSLGKSYGGREMWLLTITDFSTGGDRQKPAFYIDGGIHANEIQSVEVPLYTAWYLLEMHGQNEFIERLLAERAFYIAPMISPDSRDAHFEKPNTTHWPRTGQRPFDDDRDGRVNEDGPDDLDGDGHITRMRVADRNGTHKPHPDYPQLMIRVKEGEKGEYTLLGYEGIDNDGDGKVNEDGNGYYDPNRDWAWNWQPASVQRAAHWYPFSIKENRLIADFVMAHPNIAGAQTYHNTGGMVLRGPGAKDDKYERADLWVYDRLGKRGEELLPGYRYLNVAEDLYAVYGGEFDWFHQMQGVFCFTNELFTPFNYFRRESEDGFFGSAEDRRKFEKFLLFGEGVVKWRKVKHPQFGEIEVGGLKKSWGRQPPSFLLEEECHRNMAFTLYHADQMPRVKIQSVRAEPLEGGLMQVTAVIENTRLTPTHSAADVKRKITRPDVVSIAGKGVNVVLGMSDEDQFFRDPKRDRRTPEAVKLRTIPGKSVVYVRWLVEGRGPCTVTVDSVKGGRDEKVVK